MINLVISKIFNLKDNHLSNKVLKHLNFLITKTYHNNHYTNKNHNIEKDKFKLRIYQIIY
jgi:hypothetical protein